ncbi:DNA polymerase sliding clamp PCNA [Haloarcula tailed virus 3]|uniref:DNA polymerase sliding clamp PCNA n=1 Tax=Haloarcula tailed virus 3 TaxID=2877990 RepID=A0AAE9BZL2_9CAUD|nr:DNA polymerase sliding clamp PCNA [Haloarcula tailed virus 3]UBF23396.1 DNA polymerase sliding clamp PCNA [Haloarcula tailed virus 3]
MSKTKPQMIEASIDPEPFAQYLNAVSGLVDEAKVHIGPDGLRTEAVDPANVAMVAVELDADAFETAPTTEHTFGAYITRLLDILPREYGTVDLTYDPNQQKLDIRAGPYSYTYNALDPENVRKEPDLPDMDLNFEGTINSDLLKEAIEWFDHYTTHVRMGYDPVDQRFWMDAMERDRKGDPKTDDGGFSLDRAQLDGVEQVGEANSHFSMDYLRERVDVFPEDTQVTLRVGKEFPMNMFYGIENGEVEFMMAPRIQSD